MTSNNKTATIQPSNILITYKYKDKTRTGTCTKASTIREVRRTLEKQIALPVKDMKLLYKSNNILLKPETTKVYDYFGDIQEIELEVAPKDFSEEKFLADFERAFIGVNRPEIEEDPNKPQIGRTIKSVYGDNTYQAKASARPYCNLDNKNEATYVCINCGLFWCQHCMKYEIHKEDLGEISKLEQKFKYVRDQKLQNLTDKITNDATYSKVEKIDFLLNEKVTVIEKQFNEMIAIIQKIKESQMKFIIDYFYQKLSDNKFKAITPDVDALIKYCQDLDKTYQKDNIPENIKRNKPIDAALELIYKNFEDFKLKYNDFNNIFVLYNNFNQTLLYQLEAKIKQSSAVSQSIMNPVELEKEIQAKEDIDENIGKKGKSHYYLKIKYYNKILLWDHLKQTFRRDIEFNDQSEFKMNYQVYAGNIFLNLRSRLFIITGGNFNMFYFYDPIAKEIFRLQSLADNHCRGGMIFSELIQGIICISGKYSNKVELFTIADLKYPSTNQELNSKLNYMTDEKLKWKELSPLNIARHYASFAIHDTKYLYAFFGNSHIKGDLEEIEKLDLSDPKGKWEIIKYSNPKTIEVKMNSHAICYSSKDEIFILGGCSRDKYVDRILKYNFKQSAIFKTEFTIPCLLENNYYRFWEESSFLPLSTKGYISNSDDDFTFGLMDARDKLHLFNIKTFKYTII